MNETRKRAGDSVLDMSADEFRVLGHGLVDRIAEFYGSLGSRKLTRAAAPQDVRQLLAPGELPEVGENASDLIAEVAPLLFDHSLHNGQPKFLGYITSSGAPLGALADLLAAAVNANLAKWELSPIASEIEAQTIRWIAELVGYPADCGGIMVSGGNSANLHAFMAARQAAAAGDMRQDGIYGESQRLTAYVSAETHTWIEKAADFCGLGASSIRWIETDHRQRMRLDALEVQVESDRRAGHRPFIVVANAGTIGTGAIDPINRMAAFCREQSIWFHVDGAYGAPAASLPEAPADLRAIGQADSLAIDPHKWLYCPIEAASVLTKNPNALRDAFDFRPDFYRIDDDSPTDYFRQGLQNTRGFRALKVWMCLRQAGADGYRRSIRQDIALARYLYRCAESRHDIEAHSQSLSVATFRYVPADFTVTDEAKSEYLNKLNRTLVAEIQASGEAFVSNAVVDGKYLLRTCVVNFRTTESDVDSVLDTVCRLGGSIDKRMRSEHYVD